MKFHPITDETSKTPPPRSLLMALLCALALVATQPAEAAERVPKLRYHIKLSLDPQNHELSGRVSIHYRHDGRQPLTRLPLVCYPERFREAHRLLSDRNFHRYYPRRHQVGALSVSLLTRQHPKYGRLLLEDVRNRRSSTETRMPDPYGDKSFPRGLIRAVHFQRPLRRGQQVSLELSFRCQVPKRYGAFGHVEGRGRVEGGFHPFVPELNSAHQFNLQGPPMAAQFEIKVAKGEALVAGRWLKAKERLKLRDRSLSVAWGGPSVLKSQEATDNSLAVRVYGDDAERAQTLIETTQRVFRVLRRELEFERPKQPVVFIEAPLRDRLFQVSGGVIFYSDRLFHVVFALKPFHERALINAVLQDLFLKSPLARCELSDSWWLAEGLSYAYHQSLPPSQLSGLDSRNLREFLDFFSFIPTVDQILRAPRFANSDLYFGSLLDPQDAVRDSLERYACPRARGRLIVKKMLDKLGPKMSLKELLKDWMAKAKRAEAKRRHYARRHVKALKGSMSAREWSVFFDIWLYSVPDEQLRIAEVEAGDKQVRVTVERVSKEPRLADIGDPVTVELESGGRKEVQVWDGRGQRTELSFPRYGFWVTARVDPERSNPDPFRGDNRWPNLIKVLLNRFQLSPDLNGGNNHSAAIGLTILPFRRYDHPITIDAFYERMSRGLRLGYSRGFGAQLDARSYGLRLGGQLNLERLDAEIVSSGGVDENGQAVDDDADNLADVNFPETRGTLVSFELRGGIETRRDPRSPSSGLGLGANLEVSSKAFGSDFEFQRLDTTLTAIQSIVRGHALAFQTRASVVSGSDIPTQRLANLGGEGGVRGVETQEFLGRQRLLFRFEYRHLWATEFEWNLIYFAWMRRLEGAVFWEIGDIGRSFARIIDQARSWKHGVGYGLRFHVDVFGVRGTVARFDLAYRTDRQEGRRPLFYFGVNQSF